MESKLTLKLDAATIDKAKIYAQNHKKSLSALVEEFFRGLGPYDQKDADEFGGPVVRELSGIIDLSALEDWKDDRGRWLERKYG
jgi:hypothetical protein